jgi:ribosomal-protein-alanine N-acetyltransferase
MSQGNEPDAPVRSSPPGGKAAAKPSANVTSVQSGATVRKYRPGDSEAVLAISERSPEAAQWSAESYGHAASSGQIVLLAEVGDSIAGFLVARVIRGEAEILNLAIDPPQRRKGLAKRLLIEMFAQAKQKGADRVFLEVRASNLAAISFYGNHGFCPVGKRAAYYCAPTEDALIMEKKITA